MNSSFVGELLLMLLVMGLMFWQGWKWRGLFDERFRK